MQSSLVDSAQLFYGLALISTLTTADFAALYRFSVALAGVNEEAEHLVHEVLDDKLGRLPDSDNQRLTVKLLHAIWEARPEPRGDAPVSNLPPQFQWMKTRDRAVVTLYGLDRFSAEEIVSICGPGDTDASGLMTPEKIVATVDSVVVSPELLNRFAVTVQGTHPPFRLFSPLGICLIFAGLVLCGTAAWMWRGWHSEADHVLAEKFIDAIEESTSKKWEPIDTTVGELSDVLFLKYGLENYPIPPAFADSPAAKLGINHVEGHPVVQIGLKNSPAWLILFRAEDFGLEPDVPDWQIVQIDDWALAVRSQNQQGNVLTLKGSERDLRALLPR